MYVCTQFLKNVYVARCCGCMCAKMNNVIRPVYYIVKMSAVMNSIRVVCVCMRSHKPGVLRGVAENGTENRHGLVCLVSSLSPAYAYKMREWYGHHYPNHGRQLQPADGAAQPQRQRQSDWTLSVFGKQLCWFVHTTNICLGTALLEMRSQYTMHSRNIVCILTSAFVFR